MITTTVHHSSYKGLSSIVLESPELRIITIPSSGGKIQSVKDKRSGWEYLVQNPEEVFRKSRYGEPFSFGDMSGFDEAFPTIEECTYPDGPWRGTTIPDHGEVWAEPWAVKTSRSMLALQVHGVRLPYSLSKRIHFIEGRTTRIEYTVANLSNHPIKFAWAPHLLLNHGPQATILLPPSVHEVVSTCNVPNRLGAFGARHRWPVTDFNAEPYDISRLGGANQDRCEKFYVDQLKQGWCGLVDPAPLRSVNLSFPISLVPYLGVWIGELHGRGAVALEPCTGDLDSLASASTWKRVATVPALGRYRWHLNIRWGTGSDQVP